MEIYIVDRDDNEIGTKEITTVDWTNDIYRASAIWLFNDDGEVLIAQRAFTKEHSPGTWGPSAAGIIEIGDWYENNILNEVKEEIGITLSTNDLIVGPKPLVKSENPNRQYFTQYFFARYNGEAEKLTLQEDEVAAVKWINTEELLVAAQTDPDTYSDIRPAIINALKDHEAYNA